MAKIQYWNGSRWVYKTPKKHVGNGVWQDTKMRFWDGKSWQLPEYLKDPPPEVTRKVTKTVEFPATWGASYEGNNNIRNYTQGRLYQGKYGYYDPTQNIIHNPIYFGIQRSLIGFDYKAIQKELVGATISKVELYLHIQHSWYYSGATARISTHGFTYKPNVFGAIHNNVATQKYRSRNEGHWIPISSSVWADIAKGNVTGFGLFPQSDNLEYYGYWHGVGSKYAPKIRITYTKIVKGNEVVIPEQKTPTLVTPAKYITVKSGWGLVQVVEELIRQGHYPDDFFTVRNTIMRLNNFSSSAPVLHPGDQIKYKEAVYK